MSKARQLADLGNVYDDGALSNRNRIINGDMRIDQRNGGASVTPTASSYTLDRFRLEISQASKLSVEQNAGSVTPPEGFTNYLGITSTSAYSVFTGDFFLLSQRIEGFNVADLGWGTSYAKSVTLSFRVRSSLTGSFGGVLTNSAQDRSYPFTYSIPAANTWTTIEVTIVGDTTGTWLTNNGLGLFVYFGLGIGTTYGSGTAGAWAAGNIFAPTGSTSVVGTNGATFYITGVQLEVGDTATPFEHRLYGDELARCQRYYEKLGASGASGNYAGLAVGYSGSTGTGGSFLISASPKRVSPTVSSTGALRYIAPTSSGTWNLAGDSYIGTSGVGYINVNSYSPSVTTGHAMILTANNDADAGIILDAEL